MKRFFLIFLLFSGYCFRTYGQTEKGTLQAGISVSLMNANDAALSETVRPLMEDPSFFFGADNQQASGDFSIIDVSISPVNTTSVLPQINYFIKESFSVGAKLGVSFGRLEITSLVFEEYYVEEYDAFEFTYRSYYSYLHSRTLQFAPFARYYYPLSEEISLFGQAEAIINVGEVRTRIEPLDGMKAFDCSAGLRLGISYLYQKWLTIEASTRLLEYGYSAYSYYDENSESTVSNSGFTPAVFGECFELGGKFNF